MELGATKTKKDKSLVGQLQKNVSDNTAQIIRIELHANLFEHK